MFSSSVVSLASLRFAHQFTPDDAGDAKMPHPNVLPYDARPARPRMKILVNALVLPLVCSGCTVVSVAGSVLSTTVSVAGTVVETGVSVAGSAVRGVAHAVSGPTEKN
jgi:hypothetical protein